MEHMARFLMQNSSSTFSFEMTILRDNYWLYFRIAGLEWGRGQICNQSTLDSDSLIRCECVSHQLKSGNISSLKLIQRNSC
jgi:hypothetical protein